MKAIVALAAVFMAACAGSPSAGPRAAQPVAGDSCAVTRPEFGTAGAGELSLFAYDTRAPLNLQRVVEDTRNNVEINRISFDSPGGGRATGLLFDPVTRRGMRPGIVLMHGMPGSARNMTNTGLFLADRGAVVIAIDAPYNRRVGEPLRFTPQDAAEQIQLMKDLQRAVDLLRAEPNVDSERIAFYGISYGAAMGMLFAGIEQRIRTAVLAVADGGHVTHATAPGSREFFASLPCATRVAWLRAMTPIEPIRFIAHAPPTTLLLQSGRQDNLVPAADAEAVHKAAPPGSKVRWYDAGHGLNQQAMQESLDWLRDQIGLGARP